MSFTHNYWLVSHLHIKQASCIMISFELKADNYTVVRLNKVEDHLGLIKSDKSCVFRAINKPSSFGNVEGLRTWPLLCRPIPEVPSFPVLAQQWWVWLGRPRRIQINTKFTIIKHNAAPSRDVKQHQHLLEINPPNLRQHDSFRPRRAPGNGLPSSERRRLTDRPDSANSTSSPTRTEPTRPEAQRSAPTPRGDSPWFRLDGSRRGSHRFYATSLDTLEQKAPMVPYQEVRSTSQTPWEPRRMFSQVATRRPPDLSGGAGWGVVGGTLPPPTGRMFQMTPISSR